MTQNLLAFNDLPVGSQVTLPLLSRGTLSYGQVVPSTSGTLLATDTNALYVDPGGNDVTGDGSRSNPFRTVAPAIARAVFNGATAAFPFAIRVSPGNGYGAFTLAPFTFVQGSGIGVTFLDPTAAQVLGAGFAGTGVKLAGISNATINTNLTANFSSIGSTGAGKVQFINLDLLGNCTLTGATSTNNALVQNCGWQGISGFGKTLAITDMANVDLIGYSGAFGAFTIVGHDAYFQEVQGIGVSMFSSYSQTWTGATVANALDCSFDVSPGAPGSNAYAQPTVSGLGSIYTCGSGIVFRSFSADGEVQFNPFLTSGAGSGASVIGCDAGLNHFAVNAVADIILTLRRPSNATRISLKNESGFNVTLSIVTVGVTGDPSYIGPYGYCEFYFSSGAWLIEEETQTGSVALTNGVSAAIPADISAASRIVATLKTPNGAAGVIAALGTDRVNGTKSGAGVFKLSSVALATGAVVATDQGTYDWFVFPGRA